MRLLNTRTLKLETLHSLETPLYAILSHTWGDDEILFNDVQYGTKVSWRDKAGSAKVLGAAELARYMRYDYLWVDSCCIEKTSSAELSEAINSMYQWYQKSDICFTYLVDVRRESFKQDFPRCRWFTRGWTLQELIAPKRLQFFDVNWVYLGNRRDLAQEIEQITQISQPILLKQTGLSNISVSCRMAWAAGRVTTRKEDEAYSLMGIFDVNMPLLYGEGDKAFRRLQEEIIRRSNDHSVLLCGMILSSPATLVVLAPSPDCFSHGQEFTKPAGSLPSFIQLQGDILEVSLLTAPIDDCVLAILDSSYADDPTNFSRPALLLEERHALCTRKKMDIFRVTPIDDYTAQVKSHSREFRLELSAIQRRMLKLSLSPVAIGSRALEERAHGILRLNPIIQGPQDLYVYGPCYPQPWGSTIRLSDDYVHYRSGIRACISLIHPGREILRVIIWILEARWFDPSSINPSYMIIISETSVCTPAESQLFSQDGNIFKTFLQNSRPEMHRQFVADSGPAALTTADNVEVTANITTSQFLERNIMELEISCEPRHYSELNRNTCSATLVQS